MKDAIHENQIPPDQAWRIFSDWKENAKQLGVLFVAGGGFVATSCTLQTARNGTVTLRGQAVGASFRLQDATFLYGPMQTWPNWPNPPIVEVVALQAMLPNGTWIVMAEGMKPEALSPRMLPQ